MPRVLLANLAQETCSFVQSRHTLEDFRRYYLYQGQEILDRLGGGGMEISGIIVAAAEDRVELVPLLATYGGTGGPVANAAYAYLSDQILAGGSRQAAEADGAILALHGAMLIEELDDPEGDLLAGLRQILGPAKPIVCSLDLHAHVTDLMVEQATAFVAYHTHPHVDFYDTGHRAMKLLARTLRGEVRPVMAHRKLQMIAPPEQHNTNRPPMAPIMECVLDAEKEPGMLAAALFPVQPQLDVPNLGWSVVVVADGDPALARARADEIGKLAWGHRREFLLDRTPVRDALRITRATKGGPIVLADSSDGTAGGAEEDSTVLLQVLLESPVPGPCLLLITDPDAVTQCVAAGVGAEVSLEVGGKLTPAFFRPTYEPFAKAIIELDAPGPTDSNLARLPYTRVTRPLFPLDDI